MKGYLKAVIILVMNGLLACQSNDFAPTKSGLLGTWLYAERGYSPGFGYFINKIPPFPPQTINFGAAGEITVQGKDLGELAQAHYYRIDSSMDGLRLVLLSSRRDSSGMEMALTIKGDTLKLSPPCYEGCHYGFLRIH